MNSDLVGAVPRTTLATALGSLAGMAVVIVAMILVIGIS